MPKRLRLTRRVNLALRDDRRRFTASAAAAGPDERDALPFPVENVDCMIDEETCGHRVRLRNAELEDRKR